MDEQNIQTVREWLARMERHLEKAIALSERIEPNGLDEETDLFWALVKYAENVQECVTQLDKVNNSVFPALIEIPSNTSANDDLSWDGLKGMRIRLAHKFWSIDPDILWKTVKRDFPVLLAFLKTLVVSPQIGSVHAIVDTDNLALSSVSDGDKLEFGNSVPLLYFDQNGKAQCFRVGWKSERELVVSHSAEGQYRLGVWGKGRRG